MSAFNLFQNSEPYKDLSSSEFESRTVKDPLTVILDVRTEEEFLSGHIPGAIHLDVTSSGFSESLKELDKNKSYYVYCRSGVRSSSACHILARSGFTKIYNLDGGIMNYDGKIE